MSLSSFYRFQSKRWVFVLQHVVLWLFIFALPYLMQYNYGFRFRFFGPPRHFFYMDIATKLIWVVVFYLNAYIFTPRYIYRKKYIRYGLLVVVMLVAIVCCNNLIMSHGANVTYARTASFFREGKPPKETIVRNYDAGLSPVAVTERIPEIGAASIPATAASPLVTNITTAAPVGSFTKTESLTPVATLTAAPDSSINVGYAIPAMPSFTINFLASAVFNLAPYFLTLAASLAFRMIRDKTRADALVQEKQQESLKTELSFLRSQISPHFMFNVLNNINALARLKSDELEPTIIKLSSLMRYMLYETNVEKVPLKSEVAYLRSYIDLQLQRFGTKVKVGVVLEDQELDNHEIEPMLLVPFVENAFKHGMGRIDNPEISIHLYVREHTLFFTLANKYRQDDDAPKDKSSGIGLANVQRRLNLLYEQEHMLTIEREEDGNGQQWFSTYLKINLH